MQKITKINISFASDFRIGSGYGLAGVVDQISVKNADGLAVIPASTIKGRVRMACMHAALALTEPVPADDQSAPAPAGPDFTPFLSQDGRICRSSEAPSVCKFEDYQQRCVICRLFGSVFREGVLVFSDAVPDDDTQKKLLALQSTKPFPFNPAQSRVRNNVKISRWNRGAESKMLRAGEVVDHRIAYSCDLFLESSCLTASTLASDLQLLQYGMALVSHLGAEKARGLGECTITLEENEWSEFLSKLGSEVR